MVSVYEGGSMAYPLYTSLCGAGEPFPRSLCWILQVFCLASASIWECSDRWKTGEKIDPGKLFSSAIRTPAFIASVLGIIAGLTGVVQKLLAGPFAGTYTSVENILTTSITSVILLVVGFSIEFDKKLLSPMYRGPLYFVFFFGQS